MGWPIRPPPIPGESLTSWALRQAYANKSAYGEFTRTYFGTNIWKDLDSLESKDIAFQLASSHITGGAQRAFEMTLQVFKGVLGKNRKLSSWRAPVTLARRYCPGCFGTDTIPYLRLSWRLNLMSICLLHACVLQTKCGECDESFRPTMSANRYYNFGKCANCGFALKNTHAENVRDNDLPYVSVSHLWRVLEGLEKPEEFGWMHGSSELFEALLFMVRFLNYMKKGTVDYRLPTESDFWNGSLSRTFLSESWQLLQDDKELTRVINDNFKAYRRVRGMFGLPSSLRTMLAGTQSFG